LAMAWEDKSPFCTAAQVNAVNVDACFDDYMWILQRITGIVTIV